MPGGDDDQRVPAADTRYGVYVHVPFCRMLCTYCDFVKYRGLDDWFDRYVEAVRREADHWAPQLAGRVAASLYLGGGTPSVLGAPRLGTLQEALAARFAIPAGAERGLEMNPEDVTTALAEDVVAAGFQRVSMGIQTFDDALLRRLGRLHTGEQAARAVGLLARAGLRSIGADLMFGLPGQTLDAWRASLEQALDLGLHHLSCYGLTVEPATPLGRHVQRGRATLPDDDAAADMYDLACDRLRAAGYRHYEVSNWALPGHESRHNGGYWQGRDYVGLGPAAVGCLDGCRWRNVATVPAYCAAIAARGHAVHDEETLSHAERRRERLLLALRTADGLDLDAFAREAGMPLSPVAEPAIARLASAGILSLVGGRLTIPEKRWAVLNAIAAELLATFG